MAVVGYWTGGQEVDLWSAGRIIWAAGAVEAVAPTFTGSVLTTEGSNPGILAAPTFNGTVLETA